MNGTTTRAQSASRTEAVGRPVAAGPATVRPPMSTPAAPAVPVKLLRFPAVRERTGLSRSTIWRLERRGEFPKHHRIAPNIVAWSESEVSRWIEERVGADDVHNPEPALVAGNGRR